MTKGINVRNSNIRLNNPTDNEKEKYQNSPVSITRNGDVGLNPKLSLFSSLDGINDATIGLKVTKENFPNKLLLVKLNTDSVRITFGLLE